MGHLSPSLALLSATSTKQTRPQQIFQSSDVRILAWIKMIFSIICSECLLLDLLVPVSKQATLTFPDDVAREPFVYHVLTSTRHRLLPLVQNLKHMEAGLYPGPQSDWIKKDYDLMSQYGLAFATALILKTAPPSKITSVRVQGVLPLVYHTPGLYGDPAAAGRFLVRNVTARLEHFAHYLTCFELDIDDKRSQPMPMTFPNQQSWPDPITFWAEMLEKLQSLRA